MQAERSIRSRTDLPALSDVIAAEIAAGRIAEEDLEQFAECYPTPFADVREGNYHGRGGRWSHFEPRKAS